MAGVVGLSLAVPASAETLVITHPETELDEKARAGPRTQELLASRGFREKVVLMTRADRSHYSFDPDAPGVSFRRVISGDGRLEQDLGDTDFVVGGGFLTSALQETVADLLHRSGARRVRYDLAAVYAVVSEGRVDAPSAGPIDMREYERLAPREAAALFARAAERVYGSLKRRGLGDRALEVRVKGRVLGVVDHDSYSPSTPGDALPQLRPASGRPAHAVLEFD